MMKKIISLCGKVFIFLVLCGVTAGTVGAYMFIKGVESAPIPDSPESMSTTSAISIVASDGSPISTIQPPGGVREIVSSSQISPYMKDALTSAEDRTFDNNFGFSPRRIAAAAFGHLRGNDSSGGGSTITQQLVKNTLVGNEYSLQRKWKELLSSTRLTAAWSKDDIITAYLNTVYFGRGALGIEKAAQAYFGVHASELTPSQAALLAGVIQSPSAHDPAVNKDSAVERFNYVADQMERNGKVSDNDRQSMSFPQTIPSKPIDPSTGIMDYRGLIASQVMSELAKKGIRESDLFAQGATITTTIDPKVEKTIVDNAHDTQNRTGLLAAATSIDNSTGAIRGFYGGDEGQGYDRANNPQLTGSSFKIFTLAAALESGAVSLSTPISSDPYQIGNHTVNNSEGMSCGTCSVAEATKQSLNTSFYRIVDRLPKGPSSVRDMAHLVGVDAPLQDSDGSVNHSITLGTYGASMTQMAHGLSTILNGGIKHDAHIVDKVTNRNGQTTYFFTPSDQRVVKQSTSDGVRQALAPIADYSNNNGIGKPSYAKTGTTEHASVNGANRDGLMIGGSDNITTAVWVGTDNGAPINGLWGATYPASMWSSIMRQIG